MSSHPDKRIVFMGTPEFAVASLQALVHAGFNIVAVITAPDKPAGRGLQLQQSAVKKYAVEKGLPVLQPEKLKNPGFVNELRALKADLQVVVAFRMLPEVVWAMPPMGTINVHGSLLPQYRGAAPINWAVINGEKETGVTTFQLQHEIDTGGILLQEKMSIGPHETAGEVHDRIKELGAQVLVKTVQEIFDGTLKPIPQDSTSETELKHAPKLTTATSNINWNKATDEIYNLIRGLSPYPAACTQLNGKLLKIYRAKKTTDGAHAAPGTVNSDGKNHLHFATTDGWIDVLELQLEGKKRMSVQQFLSGYRFK